MHRFCMASIKPHRYGLWLYSDLHIEQLPLKNIILIIFVSMPLLTFLLCLKGKVCFGCRMNIFWYVHWRWHTPAAEKPLQLPPSLGVKLPWELAVVAARMGFCLLHGPLLLAEQLSHSPHPFLWNGGRTSYLTKIDCVFLLRPVVSWLDGLDSSRNAQGKLLETTSLSLALCMQNPAIIALLGCRTL